MQELTYLEPGKIRESGITVDELKKIMDTSNKHMLSMVRALSLDCRPCANVMDRYQPPTTFLTYTVLVTPDWSDFPPAPSFVKKILVPYVFSLSNRRVRHNVLFSQSRSLDPIKLWQFVTKA